MGKYSYWGGSLFKVGLHFIEERLALEVAIVEQLSILRVLAWWLNG
jgi:hypothetical protein